MEINALCIIVTYNPDISSLNKLIQSIKSGNAKYIIIDNCSDNINDFYGLNVIHLDKNYGIAFAQNFAVNIAFEKLFEIVIFFDQDTLIDSSYIQNIARNITEDGEFITAPIAIDRCRNFVYPVVTINKYGVRRKFYPKLNDKKFYSTVAISSGMAVRLDVFRVVGLNFIDLFIDYVDTEWCLRANRAGYKICIDPSAVISHAIGGASLDFCFFKVPIHSPERRYYRIRNIFMLYFNNRFPKYLALREFVFSTIHQIILIIYCEEKLKYIKYYLIAINHGVTKKSKFLL